MHIKTVNKAIKQAGINAELVRGDGYFYFAGEDVEMSPRSIVYVPRLNDLTIEDWVQEAQTFKMISKKSN